MKKHFNKNLTVSEKEVEQFQSSKICWIFEKLIDDDENKFPDRKKKKQTKKFDVKI